MARRRLPARSPGRQWRPEPTPERAQLLAAAARRRPAVWRRWAPAGRSWRGRRGRRQPHAKPPRRATTPPARPHSPRSRSRDAVTAGSRKRPGRRHSPRWPRRRWRRRRPRRQLPPREGAASSSRSWSSPSCLSDICLQLGDQEPRARVDCYTSAGRIGAERSPRHVRPPRAIPPPLFHSYAARSSRARPRFRRWPGFSLPRPAPRPPSVPSRSGR